MTRKNEQSKGGQSNQQKCLAKETKAVSFEKRVNWCRYARGVNSQKLGFTFIQQRAKAYGQSELCTPFSSKVGSQITSLPCDVGLSSLQREPASNSYSFQ